MVVEGLEAGETVVASAAFLIDAESSLGAAMKAMGTDAPATGTGDAAHAGHGGG